MPGRLAASGCCERWWPCACATSRYLQSRSGLAPSARRRHCPSCATLPRRRGAGRPPRRARSRYPKLHFHSRRVCEEGRARRLGQHLWQESIGTMEVRRAAGRSDCFAALRNSQNISTSSRQWQSLAPLARTYTKRNLSTRALYYVQPPRNACPLPQVSYRQYATASVAQDHSVSAPDSPSTSDLNAVHLRVQELAASALKPQDGPVPSEQRLLYVLEHLDSIAKGLVDAKTISAASQQKRSGTAASALLGSVNTRQAPSSVTKAALLALISQKAEEMMRHPNIFITPAILAQYAELQTLLHQPSSFPDVFSLYANKSIPTASSNAVSFSPATPDKINTAIDPKTANTALSAAITAHDLPLAIDIIDTSFCTPSFRKAKVLRQALVPIGGLALAPVAAYSLASVFSTWQPTLDPQQATWMAFAGIMTYISAVSMTGYVAITTANDQMDRITWAQGVPLWERWVREEERAAVDRVAGAWGFKSVEKRGEEEGQDWDDLREWVGRRGMVLDKVELMDGME